MRVLLIEDFQILRESLAQGLRESQQQRVALDLSLDAVERGHDSGGNATACRQWNEAVEQRLVALVQHHIEDTQAGKDTSHACHALTMAHGDFIYWKGFWEVVDNIASSEGYKEPMVALAQLVCSLFNSTAMLMLTTFTFLSVFPLHFNLGSYSSMSTSRIDSSSALLVAVSIRRGHC